jgi:hypothetical protein
MAKSERHSIISGFPMIQNKLKIMADLGTFIFIIIILAESVVIVQAGHRGVMLYLGVVEIEYWEKECILSFLLQSR